MLAFHTVLQVLIFPCPIHRLFLGGRMRMGKFLHSILCRKGGSGNSFWNLGTWVEDRFVYQILVRISKFQGHFARRLN